MKKKYFKLFLLIGLVTMGSCSSNSPNDLTSAIPANVTYTEHVGPIIQNNCIRCHADPPLNGAPMPLTDYAKVKQAVLNTDSHNLIYRISLQPNHTPENMMPLGGPRLPNNTIATIVKWQNQSFQE